MLWKRLDDFTRDLRGADVERLCAMLDWASAREMRADHPGMGRNSKARRMFRQMREAAREEMARRGLD
jgi:hypothetical protein